MRQINVLFRITALSFVCFLFLAGITSVQAVEIPGGKSILLNGRKPPEGLKSFSLLDPERFTMKNSYSMSYSSSQGSGNLMGMYINTMEYRFKSPLIMRVKMAYQSQTGNLFGGNNGMNSQPGTDQGRFFIPSVDIIYQPFENTTISFHYRDYSSSNGYGRNGYNSFSPYGRSRSRYGYSPFYGW